MTAHGTHRAPRTHHTQKTVDAPFEQLRKALTDMRLHLPELTVTADRDGVVLGTVDPDTTQRIAKALEKSQKRWRWWFSIDGWVVGAGFAFIVAGAILFVIGSVGW
ncbi:hypothetical protein [Streptomyces sp. A1-5]|uniref:hypothetical protein n=1 Tax=Streptomyces sp. A1-5 TaxID=2738410 RepID=UPI001F3ECEB3|nr:hypothetical protein [Streptomyces sp. A1-5]UJB43623.1 hypothetical protein HRD51_25015 [Streptomyces sp. A1-5]